MGHYCQAARIAVAQIDGGTTLPFTESVRLSSDHGTQGQSGDDDELLQYIRLQVRGGKRSLLRLFVLQNMFRNICQDRHGTDFTAGTVEKDFVSFV